MPAAPAPTIIEIRVLPCQENGYPVELTLEDSDQVFSGFAASTLAKWESSGDSRVDGISLFNALFTAGKLLVGWGTAKSKTPPRHLHLRIDPPELQVLPWELLRAEGDLLAADANTPFSRYLAVSPQWGEAITARPIRILAAISNPTNLTEKYVDLSSIDVALEEQTLRESLTSTSWPKNEASLTILQPPFTLKRLEQELRQGYHILHIVAHGSYKKQAFLYLQNDDGTVQRVPDDEFTETLNQLKAPSHLVVLTACQSAQQVTNETFSGLGSKLVQIGLPAVVAMQQSVSVVTARQFTATFYQRLLAHGTIDLAMNEARATLNTSGRYDAAVPLLFMRLPDGQLWSKEVPQKEIRREPMTDSSQNRSGGINFGNNAKVTVKGDMVGGDKNVTSTTTVNTGGGAYIGGNVNVSGGSKFVGRDDQSTTGMSAADIQQVFAPIYQQLDAKRDLDPQDKEDLKTDVQDVQAEITSGDEANEKALSRSLRNIKRMAPDILDVIVTTFASPTAGVATVIRKVMEKAKAEAGS
jgi:hypothetical protein